MAKEVLATNTQTKEALNNMDTLTPTGFGYATFGVSTFGETGSGHTQSKEPLSSKIS